MPTNEGVKLLVPPPQLNDPPPYPSYLTWSPGFIVLTATPSTRQMTKFSASYCLCVRESTFRERWIGLFHCATLPSPSSINISSLVEETRDFTMRMSIQHVVMWKFDLSTIHVVVTKSKQGMAASFFIYCSCYCHRWRIRYCLIVYSTYTMVVY